MALVTNGPNQIRVAQVVAPQENAAGVADHGQAEVAATINAAKAKGYLGEVVEEPGS